ncbi:hypothetical protein HUJ04_005012 [Dendroctonus ponderosae]|nr:hypothetical protein HUJ04_005012 [Dendroctonus ponderosae]
MMRAMAWKKTQTVRRLRLHSVWWFWHNLFEGATKTLYANVILWLESGNIRWQPFPFRCIGDGKVIDHEDVRKQVMFVFEEYKMFRWGEMEQTHGNQDQNNSKLTESCMAPPGKKQENVFSTAKHLTTAIL